MKGINLWALSQKAWMGSYLCTYTACLFIHQMFPRLIFVPAYMLDFGDTEVTNTKPTALKNLQASGV